MTLLTRLQDAVPSLTAEQAQEVVDALPSCVPDLVWGEDPEHPQFKAMTPFGEYIAGDVGLGSRWYHSTFLTPRIEAENPNEAKAAANTHHRAAIIAALMGED